jgi:hypothetical protein
VEVDDPELDDPSQEQNQKRQDEGELDERLPALVPQCSVTARQT